MARRAVSRPARTGAFGRVLIAVLCLGAAAASGSPVPQGEAEEGDPWTITGERLEGSRAGTTVLTSPRAEQEGLSITAKDGVWYRDSDLLNLSGDVILQDSTRTIRSHRASYDRLKRLAVMSGDVRGSGPEGTMGARELLYWRAEGRLELRDSVRLEESGRILTSRMLVYDTNTRRAVATESVTLSDPTERTTVTGRRCEIDRDAGTAVVTGAPRLYRPGLAGESELTIEADTLLTVDQNRAGEARGNVWIRRGSVDARCGRARFDFDGDLLILREQPVARDPDGEVRGDSMAVLLGAGDAERLEVLGNGRVEYLPSAKPGERNLVLGDTLVALMDSTGVHTIEVRGDAKSLYLPSSIDREEEVGQNLSRARTIRITIKAGEARRVDLINGASGEYLLPREKADTLYAQLSDSLYNARAGAAFLESPDDPLPDSLLRAGPYDPRETVAYAADTVAFLVPDRRIELRSNGRVHYQNLELDSRRIDFEASRDRVVAYGEPALKDESSELQGKRMVYRIDRKQGFVYEGMTEMDGAYYRGEEIKRVDDKILLVHDGDYTTCDAETSHFHFHADRMKIRLKDRVIARPIVLYLKNIPVLALPYWIFPMRKGRHSGILMPDVEFGFDSSRGRFLRNIGYYWAPNDYGDAMVWGDYYDATPRWILNSQVRYKLRYKLSGNLFGSYSREDAGAGYSTRWDFRGSHDQELGERFTLRFRANFVSDLDYRDDREFGGTVDERLNRILKSNIDLRKTWSKVSLSLTADRTEYLDKETSTVKVQQNVPSIDFSVNSFPIGRQADERGRGAFLPALSTVYTRLGASIRSTYSKPWEGSSTDNQAARISTGLTDNRKLGPYLSLSPSISATGAYFRRDNRGEEHAVGMVWDAGASARSTLYGTFMLGLGPLVGVRHVVEPSVSYRYAPDFSWLRYTDEAGRQVARFPSVGGISLSGAEASAMSLSLTQRFHLKLRGSDPKKPRKIDNLILLTTSTSHNFLEEDKPWSTISNSVRLQPSRLFESSLSLSHDPYRKNLRSLSVQSSFRLSGGAGGGGAGGADSLGAGEPLEEYGGFGQPGKDTGRPGERRLGASGPWSVNISHSFSRGSSRSSASNSANISASLVPASAWRVTASIYYDLKLKEIRSQGLSLYRDLHCWEASFDSRVSGGNSEYYFRINVKSLPDVKYERQDR